MGGQVRHRLFPPHLQQPPRGCRGGLRHSYRVQQKHEQIFRRVFRGCLRRSRRERMADQHLHSQQHAVARQGKALRKSVCGGHPVGPQASDQHHGGHDGKLRDNYRLSQIHKRPDKFIHHQALCSKGVRQEMVHCRTLRGAQRNKSLWT